MKNILVLGGTGFVGRAVCERLVERIVGANGGVSGAMGGSSQGRITVPTRRLAHGLAIRSLPTVELVQANVHDESTLARLVAGQDAVVNLVAILHGSASAFADVHIGLAQKIANACHLSGVRRVVHVSALGARGDAPSNYLRSKAEGEAVLRAAQLDLTLLRPSVIFGAEDRFLNLFAKLQAFAPLMPLAGSSARFAPVWVTDVASAIAACLDQPSSINTTYELVGPQVYTLSELVRLAGRWSGHERPQLPLPDALGRLQALMLELLPGEPLMSRDNLDSMKVPNVASGTLPGLADLGVTATALQAVGPGYLGDVMGRARLNRWRARAGRD